MYLVAVIDWHSRSVLAWQLSNTLDRIFCLDALRQVLSQAWAARMERLLCDIKVEVASTSNLHTALPPDRLIHYEAEYDTLIAQNFATNPSSPKTQPKPIGRPKQLPSQTCLTAYSIINPAPLPSCLTSASPSTTTSSNAMRA